MWPAVVALVAAFAIGSLAFVYSSAIKLMVQPSPSTSFASRSALTPTTPLPEPAPSKSETLPRSPEPPIPKSATTTKPDTAPTPAVEAVPVKQTQDPAPEISIGTPNPHFTKKDALAVADIGKEKGFELPIFQIETLDPEVSAETRRFVGVWASKIGYGSGTGRHAMLILTNG